MATLFLIRPMLQSSRQLQNTRKSLSTLTSAPAVYHFPDPTHPTRQVLTLLPTNPPRLSLSLGVVTKIPPTPSHFSENPNFYKILTRVLAQHAVDDPAVQQAAQRHFNHQNMSFNLARVKKREVAAGISQSSRSAQSPASFQAAGLGAARGGWVHVGDTRKPPDWARIPDPEDIMGSLEFDANGNFVGDRGNFEPSNTYRIMTGHGILGLSPFLMAKLLTTLQELEASEQVQ